MLFHLALFSFTCRFCIHHCRFQIIVLGFLIVNLIFVARHKLLEICNLRLELPHCGAPCNLSHRSLIALLLKFIGNLLMDLVFPFHLGTKFIDGIFQKAALVAGPTTFTLVSIVLGIERTRLFTERSWGRIGWCFAFIVISFSFKHGFDLQKPLLSSALLFDERGHNGRQAFIWTQVRGQQLLELCKSVGAITRTIAPHFRRDGILLQLQVQRLIEHVNALSQLVLSHRAVTATALVLEQPLQLARSVRIDQFLFRLLHEELQALAQSTEF